MTYLTTGEIGRWKNLISWVNFSFNRDIKAAGMNKDTWGPQVSEAGYSCVTWASYLTSLRLHFLLCKMGTCSDFPGSSVVKNPPARGHSFNPWSGKISRALWQLSPHTTTIEPICCNN